MKNCTHKHLYKNEIRCQAVCNKIASDPIPDVKRFKKNRKSPNFQENFV